MAQMIHRDGAKALAILLLVLMLFAWWPAVARSEAADSTSDPHKFLSQHLEESPVRPVIPAFNPIHAAISQGKIILLPFLTTGSLRIAEAATLPSAMSDSSLPGGSRRLGANGIWIEFEHSPLTLREVEDLVMFAHGQNLVPVVRVKENDVNTFKPILDSGALMIVIPQIHNAEEASKAVRSCLYPPLGNRPAGVGRASGYFSDFQSYRKAANDLMSVALMVETGQAIEHIDEICAVMRPGKDVLWIGPYDLSEDMQFPIGSPAHSAAIQKVEAAAQKHGIALGGNALDLKQLMELYSRGYRIFTFNYPPETGIVKRNAEFFLQP
jgi:2-keto-3-deoxy-L-rhamnonate aldolase RhmA